MTDITAQEKRDALAWAKGDDSGDPRLEDAAIRVILATVDAPDPTLAEELRDLGALLEEEGRAGAKSTVWARTLADRAAQIEQERDDLARARESQEKALHEHGRLLSEARAEVERLTAERDRTDDIALEWQRAARAGAEPLALVCAERDKYRDALAEYKDALTRSNDRHRAEVERLTAERDRIATGRHITYAEMDGKPLPDPADVKPGEPWLIRVGDREAVANRDGTSDEWPWSVAFFDGEADDVADKAITLVSRLVPAPRVITNPDELERLAATSIIRDGLGWPGGVTDQGELMRLNGVVLDPVELLRLGPVTVLWEAGA